jgi:HAD superfamily hydrolase (TIGR01509 family)
VGLQPESHLQQDKLSSILVTDQLPAAILWDMDGTLVDTEPYWLTAEVELVASFGGVWAEADGLQLVGLGLWNSARTLQRHGVELSEDAIVQRLTDRVLEQLESSVPWRPGVRELLAELKVAGIRTAMVTMSIRRMAEHVVAALPVGSFDVLVTGDSVTNSKPHPEPYLRAAELLGVAATRCVAIEDSPPGLASAEAAGVTSIGVPFHVALAEAAGRTLWPSLAGKTLEDLAMVYRARNQDLAENMARP